MTNIIITPSATTYNAGTVVKITALATTIINGTTYAFSHWEDSSTALTRTITISADTVITATYKEIAYTLTINSAPQGITFVVQ